MTQPHASSDGESALHAPPGFFGWVAALVHTHRGRLIGYARRRGLGAEDALDAVQDSFISFLRLPEARGIAHQEEDALKLLTVILRHNVINTIAPGIIDTPMHPKEQHAFLAGLSPARRLGTTEEVARALLYLDEATFVSGEVLHLDGGAHAGKWS